MIIFFYIMGFVFVISGLFTGNGELISFGSIYLWLAIITKEIREKK